MCQPEPFPPSITLPTQPVVTQELEDDDAYQERAAILEYDGGVPKKWAEGLARIGTMDRPKDIPRQRWEAIIKASAIFAHLVGG